MPRGERSQLSKSLEEWATLSQLRTTATARMKMQEIQTTGLHYSMMGPTSTVWEWEGEHNKRPTMNS
jgi:hypothetical protein